MCRIRTFSTYALTELDYITHGAVLPAPCVTNLQLITNQHFRCVYRLPKWDPLDSQMDSPQVQSNCNSKNQHGSTLIQKNIISMELFLPCLL